jgi:hypothetical protein
MARRPLSIEKFSDLVYVLLAGEHRLTKATIGAYGNIIEIGLSHAHMKGRTPEETARSLAQNIVKAAP